MRILLVDDDEQLMEVLAERLIEQHYAVDIANNGEMGWEFVLLFNYDLIVLDWMLPDIDGITLCQRIRSEGYKMPIMLLTARDQFVLQCNWLICHSLYFLQPVIIFNQITSNIRGLAVRESS